MIYESAKYLLRTGYYLYDLSVKFLSLNRIFTQLKTQNNGL